ncbi:hypothetical protein HHI36_015977 [Cryptolaemus montrouzieri]|uniref:Uncharacterized protein n=1 Tax=Cryptolaemus montrouzieri TaxID=559131 RepID=A0ABD2N798_9CUCU
MVDNSLQKICSCTENIPRIFHEKNHENFIVGDNEDKYKSDTLILCSNFNNDPFTMLSKYGEPFGMEVEITKKLINKLGLNYQDSIDSIDDTMKHRLKIGDVSHTLYLLDHFSEDYIKDFLEICDGDQTCINRSAFKRDIAVLRPIS